MKVAYFVNHYPKVSHTFIRREILALEALGITVARIALRGWDAEVPDDVDQIEKTKTSFILKHGVLSVLAVTVRETLRNPPKMLRALRAAVGLARNGDRTFFHHIFALAEGAVLARWARTQDVEHIHAHFGTNSAEVAMLAHLVSDVPYSFTVHGSDEWDQPRELKIREKVTHARFVVAVSSYTRAQLMRWARIEDHSKIHVVHCGLEDEFFVSPVAKQPDSPTVVCVGRLCSEKSQQFLVEALAILRRRGLRFRLVLVGDGEFRPVVESTIARLGVADSVTITGWASSDVVRQHIDRASLVALPSLTEGLPVVLMEALAAGRPVVTSYVGGIPELVRDGVEGWLVPASDVTAIADALQKAIEAGSDRLTTMGAAGRQRAWERHRTSVEALKLKALFESGANQPGA